MPPEWIRRNRLFVLLVALPTLLVAVYTCIVASDEYVSESRFVIKSPNQRGAQIATVANLIQTTGLSAGQEQANEVMDYIRSRSALDALDRFGSVQTMYDHSGIDFISRYPGLWHWRARENLFKYYRSKITAEMDHDTGLVVLSTRAFSANDARAVNEHLLTLSENLVNTLNARANTKAIAEAERRVAGAQERVRRARTALSAYRDSHELVDPGKQTTGVLEVANRLVSERAALQAQLDLTLKSAPANPAIAPLRARIAALDAAIAQQNARAVGAPGAISTKLSGYENLVLEQEFSAQNLIAANAALEAAHSDAVRQQFYLERVVDPSLPDLPEFPHALRVILTTFATLTCLYFIGWMFIVGVLEHAPED